MFPNLDAELARIGWGTTEVANYLNVTPRTILNKRNGKHEWNRREMVALKNKLPGTLEYLFEQREAQN